MEEHDRDTEGGNVATVNIESEVRKAYLDYAMSVIIGRALPDVRDGLKPVHRRILYAMYKEGLFSDKKYSKCAGVVGEVLKKYHPHGDVAVYDALVRMAQQWNMRYPLIDGQGNFGSMDGDSAAAYRYTEARLAKIAEEMLSNIDEETVDFMPNFDGSTDEPMVLPSAIPNLLVNGSNGIAVGMATNIPPHNLVEVINACVAYIDNPDISIQEIMQLLPGPDFPTGAYILGREGIYQAYSTGKGVIKMRAKARIEEEKHGHLAIIVEEIPYQVNKAHLIEEIAELVRNKKIEGISDIRDESDREGLRIYIELKKDANGEVILNQLYKSTPMQESFGVNLIAIVNGQPRILNIKEAIEYFIAHRRDVVFRRTRFRLKKAEARAHILEGLKIAVDNIDEVISIIRSSKSVESAREHLMHRFELSETQANAILDMKLSKLTALEREQLVEEYKNVLIEIEKLKAIIQDERLLMSIIKEELLNIKDKYGDDRRSIIIDSEGELNVEDLIADEEMVVTVSHAGYVKRNPLAIYRKQRRGGRGRTSMITKEEDFVEYLFVASSHSYLLIFTDRGNLYWLKVHEIPEAGPQAKGKPIINLIKIKPNEKVATILPVKSFDENKFVIMATKKGIAKKVELSAFSNPRSSGIIAMNVAEDDKLIGAKLSDGTKEVLMSTKLGLAIRFKEEELRPMGRHAQGVIGIDLNENDEVVGLEVCSSKSYILTINENGFGKRTQLEEYRLVHRGRKGVITSKIGDKAGNVVATIEVGEKDEVMIITENGILIRTSAEEIRCSSRNTIGVKLIALEEGDKVSGVARISEEQLNGSYYNGGHEDGNPSGNACN
ncbi:MAG: DNA gyrase subunit A [Deltaproteobacteria bacterium]|nr:DNA gyrase subunit A [Deltaproteobacteria bacterium]